MSTNKVQKFVVEVDSQKELFEQYLRLAMTTVLDSHEELAVKVVNHDKKCPDPSLVAIINQDRYFPIILVSGWYLPKVLGKRNSYFNGFGPWETFLSIDAATQYMRELFENDERKVWDGRVKRFREKFGDGYHSGFNKFDGSVGIGYELHSCGCFPKILAISFTHIYYGK